MSSEHYSDNMQSTAARLRKIQPKARARSFGAEFENIAGGRRRPKNEAKIRKSAIFRVCARFFGDKRQVLGLSAHV